MSPFHLCNDVQCSEALIRIKRLAEYYRLHYSAEQSCRPTGCRPQTEKFQSYREGLTWDGDGGGGG